MIYLIGGPARCGKSVLARRLRKEIDGQVIAGDAFAQALQKNLEPEWVPDLFDKVVAHIDKTQPLEVRIDRLRRRDEAMWQFYEAYMRSAIADAPEDDILLEGSMWPDFLELFDLSHRAVFLVDTSAKQSERLTTIRDSTSDNNWMRHFTDGELAEWAVFNAARSRRYVKLCEQTDNTYFDIAEHGIKQAEQYAFEYLLGKAV